MKPWTEWLRGRADEAAGDIGLAARRTRRTGMAALLSVTLAAGTVGGSAMAR